MEYIDYLYSLEASVCDGLREQVLREIRIEEARLRTARTLWD